MKYETKSIMIGRMKRPNKEDDVYPCFVSFFSENDPHKSGIVPDEQKVYQGIDKITIDPMEVKYLLAGNDLVINDLEIVEIEYNPPNLYIKGKQNK